MFISSLLVFFVWLHESDSTHFTSINHVNKLIDFTKCALKTHPVIIFKNFLILFYVKPDSKSFNNKKKLFIIIIWSFI